MKKIKYLVGVSFLLFVGGFYGMKRSYPSEGGAAAAAQAEPAIRAYFVPQDALGHELLLFLDKVKDKVLVAVYWITDENIINKLIDLKGHGKEVQVIVDESSFKYMRDSTGIGFIDRLLGAHIDLLVYPSKHLKKEIGLMHNKFVVRDNTHIFTGSANFTTIGLGAGSDYAPNFENAVVIADSDIVQEYTNIFQVIKDSVFHSYFYLIAHKEKKNFKPWFMHLLEKLKKLSKHEVKKQLERVWFQFDLDAKSKLQGFFNWPAKRVIQNLTQSQIDLLKLHRFYPEEIEKIDEDISGMSEQEADKAINEIIKTRTAPVLNQDGD